MELHPHGNRGVIPGLCEGVEVGDVPTKSLMHRNAREIGRRAAILPLCVQGDGGRLVIRQRDAAAKLGQLRGVILALKGEGGQLAAVSLRIQRAVGGEGRAERLDSAGKTGVILLRGGQRLISGLGCAISFNILARRGDRLQSLNLRNNIFDRRIIHTGSGVVQTCNLQRGQSAVVHGEALHQAVQLLVAAPHIACTADRAADIILCHDVGFLRDGIERLVRSDGADQLAVDVSLHGFIRILREGYQRPLVLDGLNAAAGRSLAALINHIHTADVYTSAKLHQETVDIPIGFLILNISAVLRPVIQCGKIHPHGNGDAVLSLCKRVKNIRVPTDIAVRRPGELGRLFSIAARNSLQPAFHQCFPGFLILNRAAGIVAEIQIQNHIVIRNHGGCRRDRSKHTEDHAQRQ